MANANVYVHSYYYTVTSTKDINRINMQQGRIIEQYPTANIVERPDAERPLYQVTKAVKSPSYGALKPLLDDDNLERDYVQSS